jgi:hypothetical protein
MHVIYRPGRDEQYARRLRDLAGAPDDVRGTVWVDNPGADSYPTRFINPNDVGPARLNQWWRSDRLGSVLILAWASFVRLRSHAERPRYFAGISRRS